MTDPLLQLTLCMPLALLFFLAARHKQAEGALFEAQLDGYRILPAALLPLTARLLPAIEIGVAVALLIPPSRQFAAIVAIVLLVAYAAGMSLNLLRGRDGIDCGCGAAPQTISVWLVFRNLVLVSAAAVVAQPAAARQLGWQDLVLLAIFVPVLGLTYAMTEQLIANHGVLRTWGREHG